MKESCDDIVGHSERLYSQLAALQAEMEAVHGAATERDFQLRAIKVDHESPNSLTSQHFACAETVTFGDQSVVPVTAPKQNRVDTIILLPTSRIQFRVGHFWQRFVFRSQKSFRHACTRTTKQMEPLIAILEQTLLQKYRDAYKIQKIKKIRSTVCS